MNKIEFLTQVGETSKVGFLTQVGETSKVGFLAQAGGGAGWWGSQIEGSRRLGGAKI